MRATCQAVHSMTRPVYQGPAEAGNPRITSYALLINLAALRAAAGGRCRYAPQFEQTCKDEQWDSAKTNRQPGRPRDDEPTEWRYETVHSAPRVAVDCGLGFATCPTGIRTVRAGTDLKAGMLINGSPTGIFTRRPPLPPHSFELVLGERESFTAHRAST